MPIEEKSTKRGEIKSNHEVSESSNPSTTKEIPGVLRSNSGKERVCVTLTLGICVAYTSRFACTGPQGKGCGRLWNRDANKRRRSSYPFFFKSLIIIFITKILNLRSRNKFKILCTNF